MKYKFLLITFLIGVMGSNAFCMNTEKSEEGKRHISPPIIENWDRKSPIGVWKLKHEDIFEKKKIPLGEPLYPYHAWILEDDPKWPLHCIFCTKDGKAKVSFVMLLDGAVPVDPKKYRFEAFPDAGLIKSPYVEKKTDTVRGDKFDAWKGAKAWDPMPAGLPTNRFPAVIFKYGDYPGRQATKEASE